MKGKLEKLKKLADAMYYAAFNLTTDASILRKAMKEYRQFIIHEYCKEEPVSEELEEASKNYALNNTPWDDCKDEIQESFKAGAEWGKNQAMAEIQAQSIALAHGCPKESITEDLGDYINELSKQFPEVSFAKLSRIAVRVAKWQKEQMMAKAIEGYVIKDIEEGNGDFLLSADYLPKTMGLKDQQRVKVIVIKEG